MEYKDSYGKTWNSEFTEIDVFCRQNNIRLTIEYKKDFNTKEVYVHTKAELEKTGEVILDRNDKYPPTDEDILLELKKTVREDKIDSIINDKKSYHREYYLKNKEMILERAKIKREKRSKEQIEKIKEYMKDYISKNKEKINLSNARWKKKNRNRWNEYQLEYKRKNKNNDDSK